MAPNVYFHSPPEQIIEPVKRTNVLQMKDCILVAMEQLGREPTPQRIAEKIDLKRVELDAFKEALSDLLTDGTVVPGTRGGVRLKERA